MREQPWPINTPIRPAQTSSESCEGPIKWPIMGRSADITSRLAELMLPDGAHLRAEDWTIFYLGQTPSSAIAPMFSHEDQVPSSTRTSTDNEDLMAAGQNGRSSIGGSVDSGNLGVGSTEEILESASVTITKPKRGVAGGGLLYVLNCVRMKEDKKMRRGAMVKAMAICTPNPYIGIYKVSPSCHSQHRDAYHLMPVISPYFCSPWKNTSSLLPPKYWLDCTTLPTRSRLLECLDYQDQRESSCGNLNGKTYSRINSSYPIQHISPGPKNTSRTKINRRKATKGPMAA